MLFFITIIILLFFILINNHKEKFILSSKWDQNFIYETNFPPYRKFTKKPQDKFYSTWCTECWLKILEYRKKIYNLEEKIKNNN
jgi:hypothetical protein